MSVPQALSTPVDVTVESLALSSRNGFHLEPRCRVCRNNLLREKVNHMLATGASYAMVVRALASIFRAALWGRMGPVLAGLRG